MRMYDRRRELTDDARQLPRGGQVDLAARRQRDEVGAFAGAAMELALAVRDEHGAMSLGPEPEDGQEDLVLSAPPGTGGVDVEREHNSQSLANLRPT
jgi:hypothetical protein